MEFTEEKITMKIMLDESTQTDEVVIEENKEENKEEVAKQENEKEDERRIYNYSGECWDEKYLSPHLLTTGYEAKLITNKLSF